MLQRVVELNVAQIDLDVSVVERQDAPGEWVVEAIEASGDGDIFMTIFTGPDARKRATEYAVFKYGA